MCKPPEITAGFLDEIKRVGNEIVDVDEEGQPVTRNEKLVRSLWAAALGEDGKPQAGARDFLIELFAGKPKTMPTPIDGPSNRTTAADRVRELARERVNRMANAAISPMPASPQTPEGIDEGTDDDGELEAKDRAMD